MGFMKKLHEEIEEFEYRNPNLSWIFDIEFKDNVMGEGPFEGESRYVPYLWLEEVLNDRAEKIGPNLWKINLTHKMKIIFEELINKKQVYLLKNQAGRISELSSDF